MLTIPIQLIWVIKKLITKVIEFILYNHIFHQKILIKDKLCSKVTIKIKILLYVTLGGLVLHCDISRKVYFYKCKLFLIQLCIGWCMFTLWASCRVLVDMFIHVLGTSIVNYWLMCLYWEHIILYSIGWCIYIGDIL